MVDAVTPTVDIGRYEDGTRIALPLPGWGGAHWLLGGSSGSGKTMTIRQLLAEMLWTHRAMPIAVAMADPHGVDYAAWEPLLATAAVGVAASGQLLAMAQAEVRRRLCVMRSMRVREWSAEHAERIGPYLVVVIDELSAVTMLAKGATTQLVVLAQEMRKTGAGLVLATQSPKAKVIEAIVREQCPIRLCLRTRSPEQTEAVLEGRQWPAHQPEDLGGFPLWMRGGVYVDDGRTVRRGRLRGITEDAERHVVERRGSAPVVGGWPRLIDQHAHQEA